ncbi:hypothetical protein E0H39_38570 [Rhizobium leguminosarum bv. viciae]|nr:MULTISPECIES: hypothetical protein [Rhizobium]MBB4346262.1 hypothetical protein [Rhizobium leguminosarum]MBB5262878.1 hypothetical protein [Rhizobium leguminosarum]MBB6299384.1 hypothetical protein [Rhizobium leguminosarum]MBX5069152.1 hypothetical protein [Rhizobium lentis]MBY5345712.1 hypothetical protein [Rhizobium leguminosarum]
MKSSSNKTATAAVSNSSLTSRSIWGRAILAATAMALVSTTQVSAADFASEGSSGHSSPASERGSDDDGSYSGNNGWQLRGEKSVQCKLFTKGSDLYRGCLELNK